MADQFEKKAKDWDNIPWKQQTAQDAYETICQKVKVTPKTRLIDLGGGTGLLALKFKDQVQKITVIDTSEAMLKVLQDKIKAVQLTNVDFILDVLTPGKLPPASHELIISMMTLHHVEDLTELFKTFYEILDVDGSIALVDLAKEDGDFHPPEAVYVHDGFEPETLRIPLGKVGFKNIEIEEFSTIKKTTSVGIQKDYPLLMITASK